MESNEAIVGVQGPVKVSQIIWGVFAGMWLFSVSAAAVWYGTIYLLRATGDIH